MSRFTWILTLTVLLAVVLAGFPANRFAAAAPPPSPGGTVASWGDNAAGQLGDDTTYERHVPVTVGGAFGPALNGVVSVAAGEYHALALKGDGTVWAWGSNGAGQLGDGTNNEHLTPIQVKGLTGVTAIAAGGFHSLALKNDGTVWAWGDNAHGQLGDNSITPRKQPVKVGSLPATVGLAAGYEHSLAVTGDGRVFAWGRNNYGQLGDGSIAEHHLPVRSGGFTGGIAVAAAKDHSLALLGDGSVAAWGDNAFGELGDGTIKEKHSPVTVTGLTGVAAIATGYYHSIALKANGTVFAWGSNALGQLGDGTFDQHLAPVQVKGEGGNGYLSNVSAIAAGMSHNLALKNDATVVTWGWNLDGQLGDGGTTKRALPFGVPNLAGGAAVSASGKYSLAVIVPQFDLTLLADGDGSGGIIRSPQGSGQAITFHYNRGTVVYLTPKPAVGSVFTSWTVDGVAQGWPDPISITMDVDHSVHARFVQASNFTDVPPGLDYTNAVVQLATRGMIRGYGDGSFGPDDTILRAQMAALIARAMPSSTNAQNCVAFTWDCEDHGNPFLDQGSTDPDLWRNVGTLAFYGVAKGYAPGQFGPGDPVVHAQVLSFITRAMVAKGYWQQQPTDPTLFGGALNGTGHETDATTFVHYTQGFGGVPDYPTYGGFAGWDQPATRAWFARALWAALNSYWTVDRVP